MGRWHSANVFQSTPETRQLWQFSAADGKFNVLRSQTLSTTDSLPKNVVGKDWDSLWQKKLNVAWLPSDKVYLRALQLPDSDFAETLAMVDFQLEKISPLPTAQIVWTVDVLSTKKDNQQTVIVTIVPRSLVDDYLGQLEGQGYLADRLEMPLLDELLATPVSGDGIWIFPGRNNGPWMAAWWFNGTLQNVTLLTGISTPEQGAQTKEQLSQIAWAGELEGWLTDTPKGHLVAVPETAAIWEPVLNEWFEQPIEIQAPIPPEQLAAWSARRAADKKEDANNLLPSEYSTKYHQQFIDRLWMRGLGAVLGVYLIGVIIYFSALQVLNFQLYRAQGNVSEISQSYTNALQLKERVRVLEEQSNLKYAALDCWRAAAELLPPEMTLTDLSFQQGKKLVLQGTVPQENLAKLTDYNEAMSKVVVNGKPLLCSPPNSRIIGGTVSWSFDCQLQSGGDI